MNRSALTARYRATGLNEADHITLTLDTRNLFLNDGQQITVAVHVDDITEAGYVDEDRARADQADAVEDKRKETLGNVWRYGCQSHLDALLRAAEFGSIDSLVSPTDLALYGPVVAAIRAAIDIVAETVGEQEAWQA